MSEQHVELHVKWTALADMQVARRWFERHGLSVTAMKAGALLTGSRSQVERAFSTKFDESNAPDSLPIPPELGDHVESVKLFKPRSYMS